MADFRRYYGDSFEGFRARGVPLLEVAAMAAHLPDESATIRARRPDDTWELSEQLLAAAVDRLSILIWQKTADGMKGRNFPAPILRPGVEPDDGATTYGKDSAVPLDEMTEWLGWGKPERKRDARGRFVAG